MKLISLTKGCCETGLFLVLEIPIVKTGLRILSLAIRAVEQMITGENRIRFSTSSAESLPLPDLTESIDPRKSLRLTAKNGSFVFLVCRIRARWIRGWIRGSDPICPICPICPMRPIATSGAMDPVSGFDTARESLDEIAAGKSKGDHGRQHVENRQRAQKP